MDFCCLKLLIVHITNIINFSHENISKGPNNQNQINDYVKSINKKQPSINRRSVKIKDSCVEKRCEEYFDKPFWCHGLVTKMQSKDYEGKLDKYTVEGLVYYYDQSIQNSHKEELMQSYIAWKLNGEGEGESACDMPKNLQRP